jgi:hypothetical protein
MFRTRIREGAAGGINFAGRVAIVRFGCGALDHSSLPWSRLIAASRLKDGADPDGPCLRQDFIWAPEGFHARGSPKNVATGCVSEN